MDTKQYTLSNAEKLNQDNMLEFDIPSRDERTSLYFGDTVKLIFDEAERMWVDIIAKTSTGYFGILANNPSEIKTIRWGDDVVFGPEHIIAIADKDMPRINTEGVDNLKIIPTNENTNTPKSIH